MDIGYRTDALPGEFPEASAHHGGLAPRRRSPRTDPSMRDGDSGHGNPYEMEGADVSTDNDTGDMEEEPVEAGIEGGATAGTTVDLRPDLDPVVAGFILRSGGYEVGRVDLNDGADEGTPVAVANPLPHPVAAPGVPGATNGEPPIAGYERMSVAFVVEKAATLSTGEVRRLRDYEASHRNRKTLLLKLDRLAASATRKRQQKAVGGA